MKKKNLLFFMTDQQRFDTLYRTEGGREITPAFNRLGREGTYFERMYDACPLCVPARTALATGRNPLQNGMMLNDLPGKYARDNMPIHEILKRNGYQTVHIGVNHISIQPPLRERVSFDAWEDDDTYARYRAQKGFPVKRNPDNTMEVMELGESGYRSKRYSNARVSLWEGAQNDFKDIWFADRALEFLKNQAKPPFALFVCLWSPHPPLMVPEKYWEMFCDMPVTLPANTGIPARNEPASRRKGAPANLAAVPPVGGWEEGMRAHYALTRLCDDQFARVRQALEDCSEWDNTMVVYTADHGEHMGQHKMYQKMEMYEAAVRVPAVIRFPGAKPGHTVCTPVSHLDIVPTIADCLGLETEKGFEGKSLKQTVLLGEEPKQHDIFSVYCGNHEFGDIRRMIVRGEWKYIFDGEEGELFNLKDDPLEENNLSGEEAYRDKRLELHQALAEWGRKNGDYILY